MTGHEHNEPEFAGEGAGPARPDPALAPPADIEADARDTGSRSFARDLFSRELFRYLGPGFVVTIGFIDPGNWATNIAGGSQFGFQLLWVVSLSTLMLIFLQHLAAKLGIVTGRSLAVNVRAHMPAWLVWLLGVTIALACVAAKGRRRRGRRVECRQDDRPRAQRARARGG